MKGRLAIVRWVSKRLKLPGRASCQYCKLLDVQSCLNMQPPAQAQANQTDVNQKSPSSYPQTAYTSLTKLMIHQLGWILHLDRSTTSDLCYL